MKRAATQYDLEILPVKGFSKIFKIYLYFSLTKCLKSTVNRSELENHRHTALKHFDAGCREHLCPLPTNNYELAVQFVDRDLKFAKNMEDAMLKNRNLLILRKQDLLNKIASISKN